MKENNFLVIGRDEKMYSCRNRFRQLSYESECTDAASIKNMIADYSDIVLPLPTLANGCISGTGLSLDEFISLLNGEQTIFCGNISPSVFPCEAYSYYTDEEFLIKNSRLTAQGTLRIILENVRTDIFTMSAAVIGYGRCGKAICKSLSNNGCDVTSYSRRRASAAQAENDGIKTGKFNHLNNELHQFDIIVNTVPFNLINTDTLEQLTQSNLYIEVASRPYGFNIAGADKFNFKYVLAESLPGKFTPVNAGINIADTVVSIIRE